MSTVLEASTVAVKTMADGTLRLTVDFPPTSAQAAFRLFGSPGTPMAAARIKTAPELQRDEAKPKGGSLARLAGMWCQLPEFQRFIGGVYGKHMGGKTDVLPEDVGGDAAFARHCILVLCNIESRAELDHKPDAAAKFHELIRKPFELRPVT